MKEGLKMLHKNKVKFISLVAKSLKKQRHEYFKSKVQTDIDMKKLIKNCYDLSIVMTNCLNKLNMTLTSFFK